MYLAQSAFSPPKDTNPNKDTKGTLDKIHFFHLPISKERSVYKNFDSIKSVTKGRIKVFFCIKGKAQKKEKVGLFNKFVGEGVQKNCPHLLRNKTTLPWGVL